LIDGVLWFSKTADGATYVDEGFSASLDNLSADSNWTESAGTWEEHTVNSPGGRVVSYNSSSGFDWHNPPDRFTSLSMELWVRHVESSARKALTSFNDELSQEEHEAGVQCITSDYAWSPDGRRIAVYSVLHQEGAIFEQRIHLLVLDGAY
jgi:hypothetical protein